MNQSQNWRHIMAKNKNPQNTPAPAAAPKSIPAAAPAAAAPAPARSEIKGSGTAKAPAASRVVTQDQIALRAYEIYAGRGYAAGDQTADWLEAERQLKAGL
jgi:hypothetical protein